jgi:hypothetical protein
VIFLVNIGELFSKLFGKEFCLKKKEGLFNGKLGDRIRVWAG